MKNWISAIENFIIVKHRQKFRVDFYRPCPALFLKKFLTATINAVMMSLFPLSKNLKSIKKGGFYVNNILQSYHDSDRSFWINDHRWTAFSNTRRSRTVRQWQEEAWHCSTDCNNDILIFRQTYFMGIKIHLVAFYNKE